MTSSGNVYSFVSTQSAYLASLDTDGKLTLQLRDGTIMRFQAMQEGEVSW